MHFRLLIGTTSGNGIASVHMGNPNAVTTTATVTIKEGPEPIYLILGNTEPMVWSVTGAVNRLDKVVLRDRNSGVVGVAKSLVAFPEGDAVCRQMPPKEGSFAYIRTKSLIRASIGKEISEVAVKERLSEVSIPSVTFPKEKSAAEMISAMQMEGRGAQLTQLQYQIRMRYPVGLVTIDPAAVVSKKAAQSFDVLPKELGLAALVAAGNLVSNEYNEFRIVKTFDQFPAGLTNIRFVLAKGVAAPKGDVGNNCMISEDTGALSGRFCR